MAISVWKQDYFSACSGEFDLLYRAYQTPGVSVGTVVIVHGFGEHSGRYAHVASALTQAGFNTLLFDLPGHGHSAGHRGHIDAFAHYVDATQSAVRQARKLFHNEVVMLLGHSMGGLICMHYAALCRRGLSGLILSNPLCALTLPVPAWKHALVRWVAPIWPTGLFPITIPVADLSHDRSLMQAHDADPLRMNYASFSCLSELQQAMQLCQVRSQQICIPVLLQLASDDRVVDTQQARRLFARHRVAGSKTLIYEGFYHEIYHEVDRNKPIADLIAWMQDRV